MINSNIKVWLNLVIPELNKSYDPKISTKGSAPSIDYKESKVGAKNDTSQLQILEFQGHTRWHGQINEQNGQW